MRLNSPALKADMLKGLVTRDTTLFWFRRDLRLEDNAGLYHALHENEGVLPIFIFDSEILDKLEDADDARVTFIHDSLEHLRENLHQLGSTLLVFHGKPGDIFKTLEPRAVYTNHDYESYGIQRDSLVKTILEEKGISFHSHKDIVAFETNEVLKSDGSPYTVFTPYSRKWKEVFRATGIPEWNTKRLLGRLKKYSPVSIPTLQELGFLRSSIAIPERKIPSAIVKSYGEQRDYPGHRSTTRLGVHIRFGTVSIRKLIRFASETSETWLNELIWREFYHMILWHFPHVTKGAFKSLYDRITWRNDPVEFEKWCSGQTGYPLVDAGMRELNSTGFMHNRVRMVAASFLTKHLLIDWRWGEAYFARKLLDFELASNNGGWQWAAGTGCDAAPYFRVFNPSTQAAKFDPDGAYISRWVPEVGTSDYPAPIVDHVFARVRVLERYKAALN